MKSKFCFCAARLEERRRSRGDIEQILCYQSEPVLVSDPFEDYQWVSEHLSHLVRHKPNNDQFLSLLSPTFVSGSIILGEPETVSGLF